MVSMQLAAVLLAVSGVGDVMLLDFSADWCQPCRQMEPVVHQLQAAGYPVRKINIDQDRALANKFRVSSIPCFVMLADGKEVARSGPASRAELEAMFAKARAQVAQSQGAQSQGAQAPPQQQFAMPSHQSAAPRDPFGRPNGMPGGVTSVAQTGIQSEMPAASPASTGWQGSQQEPSKNVCPVGPGVTHAQLIAYSVRLTIEDPGGFSYGTGTLIDARQGEALVLTCGHIFRDSKGNGKITVDMFAPGAPQKVPGRLVSYDLKRDIGLISFKPGITVTPARLAPESHHATRGDKVFTVGCNHGANPTVEESQVTSVDKFRGPANLQVAGQPVQGRSGGPVFSADGLVIGVCNAADPADNEGLYAALPTIREQLDASRLSDIYRNANEAASTALAATATPPAMPARMPQTRTPVAGPDVNVVATNSVSENPLQTLSASERATLAELQRVDGDAEVICIVRSRNNPQAKSEIIVLDKASPEFLRQLAAERNPQPDRRLTSFEVPRNDPHLPMAKYFGPGR